MDYTKIPHFALFRQACTVIVRIRMEVDTCCRVVCPTSDHPRYSLRPSSCEQCSRSRSNSRYSDCDSDLVEKCRRYRSSAARSRYVNVCASVCLVLLVGGLSPQSAAAPHKRSMDSSEDKHFWENPCDYKPNEKTNLNYTANLASKVASQAKSAYDSTAKYKDEFAHKLHSFDLFDALLGMWDTSEWLRKFSDAGLPKEKVLYKRMSDDYMNELMKDIDKVLPSMYMALKMVVAGLHSARKDLKLKSNIGLDLDLDDKILTSMHQVRAVLCYFYDLMNSRGLEILPLSDSEVQSYKEADGVIYALLVYRDTLNYLEYLKQVFQKIYEVETIKEEETIKEPLNQIRLRHRLC